MEPFSTYQSYLLRMWLTTHEGEQVWQASLQSTATGQWQGFPDLESLFSYLVSRAGGKERSSGFQTEPATCPEHDRRATNRSLKADD